MTQNAPSIADLIQQHRDQTGDSYQVIARRTGISKASIGLLAVGTQQTPRLDTVKKLAAGLGLPIAVVQAAADVTAGIERPDVLERDARLDLLVARIQALPQADIDTLEVFVNALAARANREPS